MAKILFRVDAGQILHVAMGHAFRCVSLAQSLRDRGDEITFVMREDALGNDFVRSHGFEVVCLGPSPQAQSCVDLITQHAPDIVVIDLFQVDADFTKLLADAGAFVVVIDDLGNKTIHADLVVNGHLLSEHHHYDGTIHKKLLGPDFLIFGQEFDGRRNDRENQDLREILVTLGGADPMGFTTTVVNSLIENGIGKSITVIKGPGFGTNFDIKNINFGMKTQVRVQENVPDLSICMIAADLVVSAGGRTAYELAATGTPSVLVPTAAHELAVAQALAARGVAKAVSAVNRETIHRELALLVQETASLQTRQEMAHAGLRLVDGKGRQRVMNAIDELKRQSAGTG